jgi:hypothetical protein
MTALFLNYALNRDPEQKREIFEANNIGRIG